MTNLIRRILECLFSIERRSGTETHFDGRFEISKGYQGDEECVGVSLGDRHVAIYRAVGTTSYEDIERAKNDLLRMSGEEYIEM